MLVNTVKEADKVTTKVLTDGLKHRYRVIMANDDDNWNNYTTTTDKQQSVLIILYLISVHQYTMDTDI